MTEKEMRELDIWIALNIFGWQQFREEEFPHRWLWREGADGTRVWDEPNGYTADPASAMEVLEKCAEKTEQLECMYLGKIEDEWVVGIHDLMIEATADTLPIAICLFAQKLFTHETKNMP